VTPHNVEADTHVYDYIGQAIRSVAPWEKDSHDARMAAGLLVYRNNVRAAFLNTLRDSFPVIHRLVGEEFFRYLAHEYFHAYPPSSPLVAKYGHHMPEFLETFEAASSLPYLPDTARMELAWLSAYHAAEADTLQPAEFLLRLSEAPETARIILHPSIRIIQSQYPVHTIWLHNKCERAETLKLPNSGERIVVKRPAHTVYTEVVAEGVFNALAAIAQGRHVDEVCQVLGEGDEYSLADILQDIAAMNIVTAVQAPA